MATGPYPNPRNNVAHTPRSPIEGDHMSQLNRAQAEAVYNKIVAHYSRYISTDNMPQLVQNWEKTWQSPAPIIPWAVVWHTGPTDWAIAASHNDVVPVDMAYTEPATTNVLALYPNNNSPWRGY